MDQARDFFGSWSDAWHAWLVAAGAGGSVVLAAAKQVAAPAASPCGIIGVLDVAREAAFAEYPDGGSVPDLLVRGAWWSLSWNAGGRSRVTLEPYEKNRWVVTVEIRETDDGRSVSEQTDGQCPWGIAPPTHWRWAALHAAPSA